MCFVFQHIAPFLQIREVHALVDRVRQTDSVLGRVCREVVSSMHVPQVGVVGFFWHWAQK